MLPYKSSNLTLVEADLTNKESWLEATKGCKNIIHVASPLPAKLPKHESELVKPARDGTLSILEAALQNGVKKVVITSGLNTIMIGNDDKIITEEHWSNETLCPPYEKSKLLAEKAVWEFHRKHRGEIDIVTINPGLVLGPSLSKNFFASGEILVKVLNNEVAGIPSLALPIADVRDVAIAHLRALQLKDNDGKRYIIANRTVLMENVASIMREEFECYGYTIVKRKVSKWPVQMMSVFDANLRVIVPFIDKKYRIDNSRSLKELGMMYRTLEETVIDMGYNLIELGVVPNKIRR